MRIDKNLCVWQGSLAESFLGFFHYDTANEMKFDQSITTLEIKFYQRICDIENEICQ